MEPEGIGSYLRKQISDLEQDCDELHQIVRKDRDTIHDQNIYIKKLELSNKNLKEQLKNIEVCENALYRKQSDLERERRKLEDCLKTTKVQEKRLRELVDKYKLDEEALLLKSNEQQIQIQRISTTEKELKTKIHDLHNRNKDFSDELEFMKLKQANLEHENSAFTEFIKDHESTERYLKTRVTELEIMNTEMQRANVDLDQRLGQVLGENCVLSEQVGRLQQHQQDGNWVKIAGATSQPPEYPDNGGGGEGGEEELVVAVMLSPESECPSPVIPLQGADSTLPNSNNKTKNLHFYPPDGLDFTPPLVSDSTSLLEVSKTIGSYVDSFAVCSSEMIFQDEILPNTGGDESDFQKLSDHVDSFRDSGRETSSTLMVQDNISQGQLYNISSQTQMETEGEENSSASKSHVSGNIPHLKSGQFENKSLRGDINRLEKQLEDKDRYIANLEVCVADIDKGLLENDTGETHLANNIKGSIQRLWEKIEGGPHKSRDFMPVPATRLGEQRRTSNPAEVEKLMIELQQWQKECQTIEDMRSRALDSLHCLEIEVADLQKAEEELEYIKGEYNKIMKKNEDLEEKCNDLGQVASERDRIQNELDLLRMKITSAKKTDMENISLEERLKATTSLLEERHKEMEETKRQALVTISALKTKVATLVTACKQKDHLLQDLSSQIRKLRTVSKPLSLLEELGQLEASLTEEETNR